MSEAGPDDAVVLGQVTRQRIHREVRSCREVTGAHPMSVAISPGARVHHAWFLPNAVVAIYEPLGAAWTLKTVIVKGRRYAWGPDSTLLKRCSERQYSTLTLPTAPEWVQRFAWTQRPGGNPHAGQPDPPAATP